MGATTCYKADKAGTTLETARRRKSRGYRKIERSASASSLGGNNVATATTTTTQEDEKNGDGNGGGNGDGVDADAVERRQKKCPKGNQSFPSRNTF